MAGLERMLRQARELSWEFFGKAITFYLPGMFSYNGLRGRYPAISITGSHCALMCDHCKAKILEPMPSATSPEVLVEKCKRLSEKGCHGVLISGGCDQQGRLPWWDFIDAIARVKEQTDLYVSIHSGLVDKHIAFALKGAGVDQALIDVIGDDETYQSIYHVEFGISRICDSLDALSMADIPMVPHVICGLYYGKMRSETKALEIISRYPVDQLVIVSLMAIPGTPLEGIVTPAPQEIAHVIIDARMMMPRTRISLGCARQRGNEDIEILAIEAGVNRMALPSERAIQRANALRSSFDIPVSLLISPTVLSREDLVRFKQADADKIGVAIDLATEELFRRYRGKGVGGPHRWDRYWRCLADSLDIFGQGNAGAHFIVGMGETEQEMAMSIQKVRDMGGSTHLFSFYPEPRSAMADVPPPPIDQYRRIQLARYIIDNQIGRAGHFSYGPEGKILDFGIPSVELEQIIDSGEPFRTSGCEGYDGQVACNRPYANCRPGPEIRNFPFPPTPEDIRMIRAQMGLSPVGYHPRQLDAYSITAQ